MDALRIGFFVISAPRFYAGLGLLLLVLLAEFGAWRRRRFGQEGAADAAWAWNALFGVLLGARLGFVLQNFTYYRQEPWQAFAFWQGGFSPWWGVLVGAVVALVTLRRRERFGALLVPSVVALGAWLLVPPLLSPAGGVTVALPVGAIERLEGDPFDLAAAAHGPTVVNVWASWCIPCRREMPQLARAAAENPDVLVLYVNLGEGREKVEEFLHAHPTVRRDHVLLDTDRRVGTALGGVGLPTTYFFSGGEHVYTHVGEISGPALERRLAALRAPSP